METKDISLIDFCAYINEIIDQDVEKAMMLYNNIFRLYNVENYKLELDCLKNMILEKKNYLMLDKNRKKQYDDLEKKGKIAYKEDRIDDALNYYLLGLHITNHNIFNYYLGKMYYKSGNLEEALLYLERYKKNGGEKLSKCLLYLSKIHIYNKKFKKKDEYEKDIIILNRFFKQDFKFNRKKQKINRDFEFFDCNIEQNRINQVKDKTNYNECSVNEKLMIIKNMLLCSQTQAAEKLLQKLERSQAGMSPEDKEQIKQFQKNKKLYRVKR